MRRVIRKLVVAAVVAAAFSGWVRDSEAQTLFDQAPGEVWIAVPFSVNGVPTDFPPGSQLQFGNGVFLLIGSDGAGFLSGDGRDWVEAEFVMAEAGAAPFPNGDEQVRAMDFGGGRFLISLDVPDEEDEESLLLTAPGFAPALPLQNPTTVPLVRRKVFLTPPVDGEGEVTIPFRPVAAAFGSSGFVWISEESEEEPSKSALSADGETFVLGVPGFLDEVPGDQTTSAFYTDGYYYRSGGDARIRRSVNGVEWNNVGSSLQDLPVLQGVTSGDDLTRVYIQPSRVLTSTGNPNDVNFGDVIDPTIETASGSDYVRLAWGGEGMFVIIQNFEVSPFLVSEDGTQWREPEELPPPPSNGIEQWSRIAGSPERFVVVSDGSWMTASQNVLISERFHEPSALDVTPPQVRILRKARLSRTPASRKRVPVWVRVTDDVGIAGVRLILARGDRRLALQLLARQGVQQRRVRIPNRDGALRIRVLALDLAGNRGVDRVRLPLRR